MKTQQICHLFGAGEYHDPPPAPESGDFIIAADGGLLHCQRYNIIPDLVVGDFDSLAEPPTGNQETIVLPQEKDDTDMVAALREGWQRGFRIFHLYGGTGGRLDHTLANIQCIADLAIRGGRGYLFEKDTTITAIHNNQINFPASSKGMVSAFSHSETAVGVYESGLKYPLTNATLKNTYPLGISNEFTGIASRISVQTGTLIVIYPKNTKEIFE